MKCQKEFEENSYEKNKTYEGIDYHHNPPQFLFRKIEEKWNGEIIKLCRKCHRNLHDEIIKIMNDFAKTLKFIKSEYWVLVKIPISKHKILSNKIYNFTKKWVCENED